jgi:biotin carboxyl carrier protein
VADHQARRQGRDDAQDAASGHEAARREIARLAEEVLPALIGRLGASDLGELEVREGDWRVRLRKPATGSNGAQGASVGGRSKRRRQHQQQAQQAQREAGQPSLPSSYAAGSPPAGAAGAPSTSGSAQASGSSPGRGSSDAGPSSSSGNGARPPMAAVGPGRGPDVPAPRHELARRAATSPAVGYYLPNEQISPGHRVREGDLLGHVDVLGVRQDVVSPAEGVVGRLLARSGEAVEYGQELLRIDLVPAGAAAGASTGQGGPASPASPDSPDSPDSPGGSGGSGGSVGRTEPSTEA